MKKLIKIIASLSVLGIGMIYISSCEQVREDYKRVKKSEALSYWADRTGIGNSNNIVEIPEAITLMRDIRENEKFYVFEKLKPQRFPTKESAIEYAIQNIDSNSNERILEIDKKGEISAEFYLNGERYFPPEKK
jgi:hypothetical protein